MKRKEYWFFNFIQKKRRMHPFLKKFPSNCFPSLSTNRSFDYVSSKIRLLDKSFLRGRRWWVHSRPNPWLTCTSRSKPNQRPNNKKHVKKDSNGFITLYSSPSSNPPPHHCQVIAQPINPFTFHNNSYAFRITLSLVMIKHITKIIKNYDKT